MSPTASAPDAGERFRPFLFPEFGWAVVALAAASAVHYARELLSAAKPDRGGKLSRVQALSGLAFSISGVPFGIGIALESRPIAMTSISIGVLLAMPLIITRWREEHPPRGSSSEE